MADTWPQALPRNLIGPSLAAGDGRLKSQTDTGPGKIRRRSSGLSGALSGTMVLRYWQLTVLNTFIRNSLAGGTLPFYFPDPASGDPLLVRFGDSLPSWQPYGFGKVSVNIDLEVLP